MLTNEQVKAVLDFDARRRGGTRMGHPLRSTLRYNLIVPAAPFTGADAERRNRLERDVKIVTVAVRLNRVYAPQVMVIALYDPATDVVRPGSVSYCGAAGWIVGWPKEAISGSVKGVKVWRTFPADWGKHFCKWKDGLKFPYGLTVNLEALKGTRYEWCGYSERQGIGLGDFLCLYRRSPQIEFLGKSGLQKLITPYAVAAMKDRRVRDFIIGHTSEIRRGMWTVSEVVWAARHRSTFERAHEHLAFVRELSRHLSGMFGGHISGMVKYELAERIVKKCGIFCEDYARYLWECCRAGLDLRNDGTLYPPTSGGRKAFIDRVERLEREGDRRETAERRRARRKERMAERRRRERMAKLAAERVEEIAAFQSSLDRAKTLAGSGYRLILAKTQDELVKEGRRMRNCVGCGTYGAALVVGNTLILTMQGADPKERYCVEIDRNGWFVRQCYGRHNSAAPEAVRELAKAVAAKIGAVCAARRRKRRSA